MAQFYNNSIFWIEVDKIKPNPFQPRREFDPEALKALSESIKQYGVLQALVVTRKEVVKDDGLFVEYELIAGERRLRASKLAGLSQVPVLIRMDDPEEMGNTDLMKLELAIIENVQREDLNPVERARAFKRLADDFGFKHHNIAQKIGKSRVYVTNTMRILDLPEDMLTALSEGKITEGHTRPLLMLIDRPEEQKVLFIDIMTRKMTVREAELVARKIAIERARKVDGATDPELNQFEERFTETLGTKVRIEKKDKGGKILIDFFSNDDLEDILKLLNNKNTESINTPTVEVVSDIANSPEDSTNSITLPLDDRTEEEKKTDENTEIDDDLYSVKNFSV